MKRLSVLLFALIAVGSGVVACGPGPTPTLSPTPTPTVSPVQDVQVLCLVVEESYPQIEGEFSEGIAEAVERILSELGLQVMAEGEPCDATLTVTLTGEALGASYKHFGSFDTSRCYTGAKVYGEMTLTSPGTAPLTVAARARKPTISGTIYECPGKAQAPFYSVWPEAVLDGLADLWGPQVVFQALGDEDADVRQGATSALGKIGPEVVPALIRALGDEDELLRWGAAVALEEIGLKAREAIPALIEALGDEDQYVRSAAAEALGKITGQDFGEDAGRWQEWWEERDWREWWEEQE